MLYALKNKQTGRLLFVDAVIENYNNWDYEDDMATNCSRVVLQLSDRGFGYFHFVTDNEDIIKTLKIIGRDTCPEIEIVDVLLEDIEIVELTEK